MELINLVPKFELSKMRSKNPIFQQTWICKALDLVHTILRPYEPVFAYDKPLIMGSLNPFGSDARFMLRQVYNAELFGVVI